MKDIISQAKADFSRATGQIAHALATTPDEKLHWSPSSTARTPLQVAAHAAMAISGIQDILTGQPFPYAGAAELDTECRIAEKEFTTRQQVLSLLERNSAAYIAWLDTLTPERLDATFQLPFGPPTPVAVGVSFPAHHTTYHAAQIDYIQTIYGDHDWHMAR